MCILDKLNIQMLILLQTANSFNEKFTTIYLKFNVP